MTKRKPKKVIPAPAQEAIKRNPTQTASTSSPTNDFEIGLSTARLLILLVLSLAYFATAARSVTFVDSGELLATAKDLGVAHAPGTPLYTMLMAPFVNLFGAAGGSLFSALCAVACALLVFEIARILKVRSWVGALLALVFGLSQTMWFYASLTEVYVFHTLLAMTTLYFVLRAFHEFSFKWIAFAGLFFGFSLCVHHLSAVLLAPAFLYLFIAAARKHQTKIGRPLGILAGATIVGLLPYLYLFWAARRSGVFLWADTSHWQGFWFHVSGKQYHSSAFSMPLDAVWGQFVFALKEVLFFYTPLALVPIAAGFVVLKNKNHPLHAFGIFAALGAGINILFNITYRMAEDRDAYLLVSHLALLVPVAVGLQHLATRFRPRVFVAVAALQLLAFPKVLKSEANYAQRYVQDVLNAVPAGGVLMTWDWNFSSPYLFEYTQNYRRDVIVLDMHLLRKSVYIERILPDRYPTFAKQFATELQQIAEQVRVFEDGLGAPKQEVIAAVQKLGMAVVNAYPSSTYATTNIDDDLSQNTVYIPMGATTKIVPQNGSVAYIEDNRLDWEFWSRAENSKDEVVKTKVVPAVARNFATRAHFELLFGNKVKAKERVEKAAQLFAHQPSVFFVKGQILAQLGEKQEASRAYAKALELEPGNTLYLSAISNLK